MNQFDAVQLESSARKKIVDGVLHPDECAKLTIMGVAWSVRPLYPPEGIRFTPIVDGEDVSFDIDTGQGNTDVQQAAEDLIADLPEHLDGTVLVLDAADVGGYLSRVCKYLMALLDQQYELTTAQKIELLSFRGTNAPMWLEQAIRHAQSMPPEVPEDVEETDGTETA
ncbi:MAG: hypothetical protein GY788_32360 [bacterium]|nr:hypothetical protein [bacterium]